MTQDYPQPRFQHADDVPWQEVLAQDHGGRRVSVHEKWLEFSPHIMSFIGRWGPGMVVRRHGHASTNVIYVLQGSMTCGDVLCTPGMHITLDVGTPYGPLIAGPDGVELFEVICGDATSWPADEEEFERLLAERGAVKLPSPPLELPAWVRDRRDARHAAETPPTA